MFLSEVKLSIKIAHLHPIAIHNRHTLNTNSRYIFDNFTSDSACSHKQHFNWRYFRDSLLSEDEFQWWIFDICHNMLY